MKKLLVVLGLLVLVPGLAFAQATYFVDYYANNSGPPDALLVPPDQIVRIINVGVGGTPLTSPTGDICANIYVFDNNQELIACCSQQITPNELDSAWVGSQLTNNPVTSVVPKAGVIKIATTPKTGRCDATNPLDTASASLAVVFATHLQRTGGATFVTETQKSASPLSASEGSFLPTACSFAIYLGSGKGTCKSSTPGN